MKNIDDMAIYGYQYASGAGDVPEFTCDMDFAAFNCGISNYNARNGATVPCLTIAQIVVFNDRVRTSDKCLGIVGA